MVSERAVDVVVPTYDRPDRLAALLRSLAVVDGVRLGRVIVVDDSPRPALQAQEYPSLQIRVLRGERRRFMSEARNVGLAQAEEEFVLMVDDDNVVSRSTFEHPLETLELDRSRAAVMPSVLYAGRPDLVWVYACPFRRGRWGFELVGRNRPRDPNWENRLLPTDALPNAAFFRTDALRAVGGYDPGLPVNSSADLCQRLKARGGSVVADSYATTLHDVEPPGATAFWGAHGIDVARTCLEKRDWFVLQRRLHPEVRLFPLVALAHAAPFLVASGLAYIVRRDAATLRLLTSTARGTFAGLRDAAREPSVGYGPAG